MAKSPKLITEEISIRVYYIYQKIENYYNETILKHKQEGNVDTAIKPDFFIFFSIFFNTNECFPTI